MDENILGTFNPVLRGILMCSHLLFNVKIPIDENDTHRNLYFLRHILELLSLRIQMCPHL